MTDCIIREVALSFPLANGQYDREHADGHFIHGCESYREWIEQLPAADVVEVRYCRFSLEEARRRESVYKCSACGYYLTVRADTLNGGRADMNYCPFCGRKVIHKWQDGGQDDV